MGGSILGTLAQLTFFIIKMHCTQYEQYHLHHLAFKSYVCLSEPLYTTANILSPSADNGIQ